MNAVKNGVDLAREMAAIVGEQHVCENPQELGKFQFDELVPGLSVAPGNAEETAAVLRLASERGLVVTPAGNGSQLHIGAIAERVDVLLRTSRLTFVEHYDPGDLTIGVGAGMALSELKKTVGTHQQLLPIDPPGGDAATVGGVLATGAQGPLRHSYGAIRDFCLGVKFVTGDGKIAKAGGRVVKNVAGYDIMKLMAGSFGTLGVIVSANFKVSPAPRQTRTLLCEFQEAAQALQFRDWIMKSPLTPMCLELISPHARVLLAATELGGADAWAILVRAAGSTAVQGRYRRELASAVTRELEGEKEMDLWEAVTNAPRTIAKRRPNTMLMQVSLPAAAAGDALAAMERVAAEQSFLPAVVGRIGIGTLVLALVPVGEDVFSAMQYANAVSALRSALPKDSTAVVLQCPTEVKRHVSVWGSTPTDWVAMQQAKRALDPKYVLNRGRFLL